MILQKHMLNIGILCGGSMRVIKMKYTLILALFLVSCSKSAYQVPQVNECWNYSNDIFEVKAVLKYGFEAIALKMDGVVLRHDHVIYVPFAQYDYQRWIQVDCAAFKKSNVSK